MAKTTEMNEKGEMRESINLGLLIDEFVNNASDEVRTAMSTVASISERFEKALIKNGWKPNPKLSTKVVKRALAAKTRLRCLLSRHPNWSFEDQAVIYPIAETRFEYLNQLHTFYNAVYTWINSFIKEKEKRAVALMYKDQANIFYNAIKDNQLLTTDQPFCTALIGTYYDKQKVGQKMSRAINAWAKLVGFDKYPGYNKLYAALSDGLNPLETKRKTVFSINPAHILLMSNGNSWLSCHNIEKGKNQCYKAGPFSYMFDSVSAIFYTLDPDCDEITDCPKICRQMYHFCNGLLIQSRLYPHYTDVELGNQYRTTVHRILAEAMDIPNYWFLERKHDKVYRAIQTATNSVHYQDYHPNNGDYKCTLSFPKDAGDECNYIIPKQLTIGHRAICIDCGRDHRANGSMVCGQCNGHGYFEEDPEQVVAPPPIGAVGTRYTEADIEEEEEEEGFHAVCYGCERDIVNEEDCYSICDNDHVYCGDCTFYCESCCETYHVDEMCCIHNDYICSNCWSDSAFHCEHCQESDWIDNGVCRVNRHYARRVGRYGQPVSAPQMMIMTRETEQWCQHCADHDAKMCTHCEEYYADETCGCPESQAVASILSGETPVVVGVAHQPS